MFRSWAPPFIASHANQNQNRIKNIRRNIDFPVLLPQHFRLVLCTACYRFSPSQMRSIATTTLFSLPLYVAVDRSFKWNKNTRLNAEPYMNPVAHVCVNAVRLDSINIDLVRVYTVQYMHVCIRVRKCMYMRGDCV